VPHQRAWRGVENAPARLRPTSIPQTWHVPSARGALRPALLDVLARGKTSATLRRVLVTSRARHLLSRLVPFHAGRGTGWKPRGALKSRNTCSCGAMREIRRPAAICGTMAEGVGRWSSREAESGDGRESTLLRGSGTGWVKRTDARTYAVERGWTASLPWRTAGRGVKSNDRSSSVGVAEAGRRCWGPSSVRTATACARQSPTSR
jgi:hypothetical protein